MKTIAWWLILFLMPVLVRAQSKPSADLIIINAKVWTVDKSHPTAQAVAVLGDRIVAVGSNADIEAWRGPSTHVMDAGGKLFLPGFNDAHVHFVDGGLQLDAVQLNDATSAEEFARRIGERARKTAQGEWIQGGDWDETKWTPAVLPTKELIDPVTQGTPVFVSRYDGHMALANSLALRLAGVTAQTPDPPGGTIVRDAQGNPTGALKDAAMDYVYKVIPPLSHEQRVRAVKRALAYAASLGVTSVQHMNPDYADIAVYTELLDRGELTTRIYAAPYIMGVDDQAKLGIRHAFGGPYLRIGALKAYADGSLGSRTAYFFEPFTDQPDNHGLLSDEMHPVSLMRDRMMKADAAGLQLCTHAIGDQGISMILDLYSDVAKAHGKADRRFRIEHAQHMAAKDFERFAQLGVIASVQPYHAIDDGRWAEARIGHDRASRTYAFRTFLNHGVRLAFGTDWSVAPLNPLLTVYAAVTRATLDGKNPNGWFPEQKLTVAEAIEAYTMGSAYAEFQEKEKGSITPGKLADMVLVSDDLFAIAPEKIRDTKVVTTIVGGKIVFSESGYAH
ncbi:MAG TPA: amidohydrolase family protein [Terriglobales bacterium]|jgi:predicted amidohydrolase YtcJ|nr:amidohydrolase family protein [Terriglobales bacterium]